MNLINLFLERRGYTPAYLASINNSQHQELQNVEKMASILKTIHDTKAQIVIMPDFDCDGISAGTVGYAGLSQLGFNVNLYCPHPEQGYGIMIQDIDRVIEQFPNVKYIISCDVGITCYDAFFYAYQKGIKVLLTDHHEELKHKPIPKCKINGEDRIGTNKLYCETIVNPCQLSETYSLRDICGAHVFWQVLNKYTEMYDTENLNRINALRVFAGIGTIGDMMPLVKENRQLIKDTTQMLKWIASQPFEDLEDMLVNTNHVYASSFIGLKIFIDELMNERLIRDIRDLDEKFLGWTLVPIYNSIKRMNLPMNIIFSVFFGDTNNIKKQAADLAIGANQDRKAKIKSFIKTILDSQQPYAPFIYLTDAPSGMLGLLANQLMRSSGVPTFVITKSDLSGSGRSLDYFPVITKLQDTEFHVAGHEQAFGIRFDSIEQVDRFYDYLNKNIVPLIKLEAAKPKEDSDITLASGAVQKATDGLLNPRDGIDFVKKSKMLKPFGMGFQEPRIKIAVNSRTARFYTMGKESQHLKIILPNQVQLIAWNKANLINKVSQSGEFDFLGNFSLNEFNGKTNLQMIGDVD